MTKVDNHRWRFFRRGGGFLLLCGIMQWAPLGCGRLNDYVGQPMIIDASGRNIGYSRRADDYRSQPNSSVPPGYDNYGANPREGQSIYTQRTPNPPDPYRQGYERDYAAESRGYQPAAGQYGPYPGDNNGYRPQYNTYDQAAAPTAPPARIDYARNQEGLDTRYPVTNPPAAPAPAGAVPGRQFDTYRGRPSAPALPIVTDIRVSEIDPRPDTSLEPSGSLEPPPVPERNAPPAAHKVNIKAPSAHSPAPDERLDSPPTAPTAVITDGVAVTAVTNLPPVQVPPGQALRPRELTQPAVSVQTLPQLSEGSDFDAALARLERFIRENPRDTEANLALYYLYCTQRRHSQAQKLVPTDADSANRSLESLDRLQERIATQADLVVSCAKICDAVEGFGRYQIIDEKELASGKPRQALIYCELKNFESKRNEQGMFLSETRVELTLLRESDYQVIAQRAADVPDTPSHSRRQDFFMGVPLNIPALAPGQYRFTVRMEDKIARKVARPQHIYFEVKPDYQNPP